MTNRYYANEALKKALLQTLAANDAEYQSKKKKSSLIQLAGLIWLAAWAGAVIYAAMKAENAGAFDNKWLSGVGVILPIILIGIGFSMKNSAAKDVGFPYNKRMKEFIEFFEDAIEFGYRDQESRYPENMCVYTIFKENLTSVSVDDDVLTITGAGQFISYDDFPLKRVNHEKSQRKFYSDTEFKILLDFRERDIIIKQAKEMEESY